MAHPASKGRKILKLRRGPKLKRGGNEISAFRVATPTIVHEEQGAVTRLWRNGIDPGAVGQFITVPSKTYDSQKAQDIDAKDAHCLMGRSLSEDDGDEQKADQDACDYQFHPDRMEPAPGVVVLPVHETGRYNDEREDQSQDRAASGNKCNPLRFRYAGNDAEDQSPGHQPDGNMGQGRVYGAYVSEGYENLINGIQH